MKKLIKQVLLLILLTAISCQRDNVNPTDSGKGLAKTKISSLTNEPYLKDILDKVGFKEAKNGRTSGSGTSLNTDSILMALQADSVSYSYTFKIEGDQKNGSFTNLIFKRVVGGVKAFYLKYETNSPAPLSLSKFTGKVTSYDLEWKETANQHFADGIIVSSSSKVGRSQGTGCVSASVSVECQGQDKESQMTGLPLPCLYGSVVVITLDYSGCFIESDVIRGGGSNLPTQYTRWSDGTFVPSEYFNFNSRGGGPNGSGNGAFCGGDGISTPSSSSGTDPNPCSDIIAVHPPTDEELLELLLNNLYKITEDESLKSNQKAYCIYQKLGVNSQFKKLVQKFADVNSPVNLDFRIEEIEDSKTNGVTRAKNQVTFDNMEIALDKTNTELHRTIEVARTFLHEAIHASFYAHLYLNGIKTGAQLDQMQNSFPDLWDEYVKSVSAAAGKPFSDAQHNLMAEKYIDVIAKGLQEFDVRNKGNTEITIDNYKALAWVGLTDTRAYELLTDEQKDKIRDDRRIIIDWYSVINCE